MAITRDNYIQTGEELAKLASDKGDAIDNFIDDIIKAIEPFVDKYTDNWKYFDDDEGKGFVNIEDTSFFDDIPDDEVGAFYDAWENERSAVKLLEESGAAAEAIVDMLRTIIDRYA